MDGNYNNYYKKRDIFEKLWVKRSANNKNIELSEEIIIILLFLQKF